jgi:integrase
VIEATLPHVSDQVAAMIQLQRLTGMRSGEVTIMRGCNLDTRGKVWIYTPDTHKTAWHGHQRQVYLGPRSQAIIRPFLKANLQAYLFSPADAEAARCEKRFGACGPGRKTRVYPSEMRSRAERRQRRKGRKLRERYSPDTYLQAIRYGIEAANRLRLAQAKAAGQAVDEVELVPHWHPHQLRHTAATSLRREFGIEVARIILGHRSPAITEIYAETDHRQAIAVTQKIG